MKLQHTRVRRRRLFLLVLLLLILAACARDVGEPGAVVALSVRSTGPIVGAQFTLRYDARSVRFSGLSSTNPDVLAKAYDDGMGEVRVALVSPTLTTGSLVRALFQGEDGKSVQIEDASSFVAVGEPAGTALELIGVGGSHARQALQSVRGQAWSDLMVQASLETQRVAPPALQASFADYELGDLNQDGTIDVLDVLKSLDIATGKTTGNDYEQYSADLVPDDEIDVTDVARLLDKAVDPTLDATMIVKPSIITYLALKENVPILVGNSGNEPLAGLRIDASSGLHGSVTHGVQGQSAAFVFNGEPNDNFGSVTVHGPGPAKTVVVGNVVVLIAGQSNAEGQGQPQSNPESPLDEGVRMLGNDYVWKPAREPTDDATHQVDMVSADSNPMYSFGVRLANNLRRDTERWTYLIPAALGGSNFAGNGNNAHGWNPAGFTPVYNRDYLSGSAIYRGLVSAGLRPNPESGGQNPFPAEGGPVRTVVWYQGESESRNNSTRNTYVNSTRSLFSTFSDQFDDAIIVFAQLAAEGGEPTDSDADATKKNLQQADIAERQRRLEAGAAQLGIAATEPSIGPVTPVANAYMVVTHDLPMSDHIHLSRKGQQILGDRIALAVEEHVLGLQVDGTGPRLLSLSRPSSATIKVKTNRTINESSGSTAYEGYFTVFDGAPNGTDIESPGTYGQNVMTITNIIRDPSDQKAVLITLEAAPTKTPYVRYMPPPLRPFSANGSTSRLVDVVHDPDTGLPLPSFGPLAVP